MSMVLVTGGAGFIGSHLIEKLIELEYDVRVIDNLQNGEKNISHLLDKIELIKADITDETLVKRSMKDIEYVFHNAAFVSAPLSIKKPSETTRINVLGTLNILENATKADVKRVINASSAAIYGGIDMDPKRETMDPVPLSPYAASKLAAEYYCETYFHMYGLESTSLRYFNVYGPRQSFNSDYSSVIPKFIHEIRNNRKITVFGDGNQSRDFVYVDDVVNANILAMKTKNTKCPKLNIGSGKKTSINHLITILRGIIKDFEVIHSDRRPSDPKTSLADITNAKKTIGYKPGFNIEEGLSMTYDWLSENS